MNNEILTFEDLDVFVESDVENEVEILDELKKADHLYEERVRKRRLKKYNIKPLYHELQKRQRRAARYPVFKFSCVHRRFKSINDECKHAGNLILDRDILKKTEHWRLLAQPKNLEKKMRKHATRCCFVKRYLPNCTTRIESLSNPRKLRAVETWNTFLYLLSARQRNSLANYLFNPTKLTTIDKALMFIDEERSQKIRQRKFLKKETARIRNKVMRKHMYTVKKVVFSVYEIMKDFLISSNFECNPSTICLSDIIYDEIVDLTTNYYPSNHCRRVFQQLAINLAVWMAQTALNSGFTNLFGNDDRGTWDPYLPDDEILNILPVQDFIPYDSATSDEELEEDIFGEEEGGEYKSELEIKTDGELRADDEIPMEEVKEDVNLDEEVNPDE